VGENAESSLRSHSMIVTAAGVVSTGRAERVRPYRFQSAG
jgi:hypothetical protein